MGFDSGSYPRNSGQPPRQPRQPYSGQWPPPPQQPQWQQPPPGWQPPGQPGPYRRPPRKSHTGRTVAIIAACAVLTFIVVGVIASGGKTPQPSASSPAATGAPAATQAAAPALSESFSGRGEYSSPPFSVSGCGNGITVTYSYSGNSDGIGASNFIAELDSSTDQQPIANEIATSGGKTTTVYPDTGLGGSASYHLSVQADGSWKFRLTCA